MDDNLLYLVGRGNPLTRYSVFALLEMNSAFAWNPLKNNASFEKRTRQKNFKILAELVWAARRQGAWLGPAEVLKWGVRKVRQAFVVHDDMLGFE